MNHTHADLAFAERQVSTLEHFIAQQRMILTLSEWSAEEKEQGQQVLGGFEEALRNARRQYRELWLELHEDLDSAVGREAPQIRARMAGKSAG